MILIAAVIVPFLPYIGMALMAAGAGVSIYSGYQANAAAQKSAKMQTAASEAAANAQRMAAQAQAAQLRDQAELAGLQAHIENEKAGVAQQQGEIEARRRMIQLNADIGNTYAQWAGNGLLVDGGNDTLGHLLTANTREAAQDVGIIKSNTENEVWEHGMNRTMALLTQKSYQKQACAAGSIGQANATATLLSGEAQAYATRQAGLTALYQGWGSGIQMLGSAAFMGYGAFGPSSGGSVGIDVAHSGGWSGTNSTPNIVSSTPRFGLA